MKKHFSNQVYFFLLVILACSRTYSQFAIPTFQSASALDQTGPKITITATDGTNAVANRSFTNDNMLTLTFTSNEVISGFAIGDLVKSHGSFASFSGSGQSFTVLFSPISGSNGYTEYVISIPQNKFIDGMQNSNFASRPFVWTLDKVIPYIRTGTSIATDNSVIYVSFNEPLFNSSAGSAALEVSDFNLTLSSGGAGASLSSSTPSSITKSTPAFYSSSIASGILTPFAIHAVDIDSSGSMVGGGNNQLDIIIAAYGADNIVAYKFIGLGYSGTGISIANSFDGACSVYGIDMDGDGDMDVAGAAELDDDIAWFENNGTESFMERTIDGDFDGARAVFPIDLNGDGDIDVIAAAQAADDIVYYENNGAMAFTKHTIDADLDGAISVYAIDLDEDGDIDVIAAADVADDIVWYRNDGSETFTKITIDADLDGAFSVQSADLDDDNDFDVIASADEADDIVWYRNDGSENFTKITIDADLDGASGFSVADIDDDGDKDIAVAAVGANDVVWYNNNGSESFTKVTVDASVTGAVAVIVVDGISNSNISKDFLVAVSGNNTINHYYSNSSSYALGLPLSGTGTGNESITVTPVSNAIYDRAGNIASTSQSYNTAYLYDKTGPTMTITARNSSGNAVSDGATTTDSYLILTFTSSENTTNFTAGDVSVGGGNVGSLSGSGSSYTGNFTPTSIGAKTIDVGANTYTDGSNNNNTAATQFNWTFDSGAPIISGTIIASDNSTISVTFNEPVYNTSGGSGSLQTSDFSLALGSGLSILSSSTPSSISQSSSTYTLGVSLSGVASAIQAITVSPVSNQIYDVYGSVASTSQSNNTRSLNDKNYTLDLNGSNEYAYYADDSNFEPSAWSIQAWIDPTAVPSNSDNDFFIHKNKTYRLGLEYTASGVEVMGSLRYNGSYHDVNSGDQSFYVTAGGGWYHVVMTFNGTNLILYVNGDEKDTNSNSNYSTTDQNGVFSIGRRHDTGSLYYNGIIDEVAFWNTALSSSAVSALYNSEAGLNALSSNGNYSATSNLVMYLRMQENLEDSDASYDFTGNNISSSDYAADPID